MPDNKLNHARFHLRVNTPWDTNPPLAITHYGREKLMSSTHHSDEVLSH